jgi:hypothetical protein
MPQRALDVDVPRTADHAAIGQAHRPINGWGFTCAIYWGERRLWASFVHPGAWAPSSTGSTEGGTTHNRATSSWQLAGASPVRGDARLLDSRTLGIGAAGQDGIGRNPRRLRIATLAKQDPKYGRPYVLVPTPCPGPTPDSERTPHLPPSMEETCHEPILTHTTLGAQLPTTARRRVPTAAHDGRAVGGGRDRVDHAVAPYRRRHDAAPLDGRPRPCWATP